MLEPYPEPGIEWLDLDAIEDTEWVKAFINGVRKIRSGMNIPPSKPLPVLLQNSSADDQTRLANNQDFLMTLAKLESVTILNDGDEIPESATALIGETKLLIPMAGLIDKDAELARLNKEIEKISKDLARSEAKLANPNYVEKAPGHVVAKEQQRLGEMRISQEKLKEQLVRIEKM